MPWNHEDNVGRLARYGKDFWEELLEHPSVTRVVRRLARSVVRKERASWERNRTRTTATQLSEVREVGVQTDPVEPAWVNNGSTFEITGSEGNYNWTMEGPGTWSRSPSPDYKPVPCVTLN